MITYHYMALCQPGGEGNPHIGGTLEAIDATDAREQIAAVLQCYANAGLARGPFLVTLRTETKMLKDTPITLEPEPGTIGASLAR